MPQRYRTCLTRASARKSVSRGGDTCQRARGREAGDDTGADVGHTVDLDRALMQIEKVTRERQAEAGTFVTAGQGIIHLAEGLERDLDLLRRHADSGVGHRESQ